MKAFAQYDAHFGRMGNRPPDSRAAANDPASVATRGSWLPQNKEAAILDVGCGWGHALLGLWAAGYRNLTGVDLSEAQIAVARKALPSEISLRVGSVAEIFVECAFDLIVLFDVIEHMPVDAGLDLLRTCRGLLRPGGRIVIRTPNMANIVATYSRYMDVTHVVGYTEWSLYQVLEMSGFVDARVEQEPIDLRQWSWKTPWRGFGARHRLISLVHLAIYAGLGLRPYPQARSFNLTVSAAVSSDQAKFPPKS